MNLHEVRMRLLEDELTALHAGITAVDGRMTQVRGWCVTLVSGISALAVTQRRIIILAAAVGVVLLFWWIESQVAAIQRVMIRRIQDIDVHFSGRPAVDAVVDESLALPGMSSAFVSSPQPATWWNEMRDELSGTWREAKSPYLSLFYILVLSALSIGALLWMSKLG